jgi:hypothetical protein
MRVGDLAGTLQRMWEQNPGNGEEIERDCCA